MLSFDSKEAKEAKVAKELGLLLEGSKVEGDDEGELAIWTRLWRSRNLDHFTSLYGIKRVLHPDVARVPAKRP